MATHRVKNNTLSDGPFFNLPQQMGEPPTPPHPRAGIDYHAGVLAILRSCRGNRYFYLLESQIPLPKKVNSKTEME